MIEQSWENAAREINDCRYLFLARIGEIEELTLQLVITEAKLQAPTLALGSEDEVGKLLIGSQRIETDSTCRAWRLTFSRRDMVSWVVLNESYGRYPEPPEQFTGSLFRTFSRSHLLEFIKRTTCASDEHPGVLLHYELACLNHVVDVICTAPPTIDTLTSDSANS